MKKEAEREARTMWEFICTFLKWLVIAGVTGGIGGRFALRTRGCCGCCLWAAC